MLEFKQNDTAADLILTLTENVSLEDPNFLFVFTHVVTKAVVAFVKLATDDLSDFPQRYNRFTINPAALFVGADPGSWSYVIYEQADPGNLDPLLSGAALEYGQLLLYRAVDFSFNKYDSPTSFKTYNG